MSHFVLRVLKTYFRLTNYQSVFKARLSIIQSYTFRSDPRKFYAQVQARGEMGIREIAERIQRECTLTRADTIAVLTALEDVVSEGLQGGEIVRLGELGSLQVSVSGQGVEKEEEYNDGLIERKRILFRPGRTLRDTLSTLSFERVEVKPKSKGKTEEEVL